MDRVAWILILVGLAMLASGCSHPLRVAAATTNAAAEALQVTHAEMSRRYQAEQIETAKRVQGDRGDPSVIAEMRDRVQIVRDKWAPIWAAYELAYHAWEAAVRAVEAARSEEDSGGVPVLGAVFAALGSLANAQGDLSRALGQF